MYRLSVQIIRDVTKKTYLHFDVNIIYVVL